MAVTWSQSSGDKAATWSSSSGDKAATWSQSSGDIASTWSSSSGDKAATWSQSSGDIAAAWLGTELMQFGFLFWEGVDYNWDDTMAYTDTYGATQQTESSGKWEDLG